ncbi:MAG: sulfite exporter TauE/SafE family protein [Desulfobacterales bacterium]
MNNIDMASLFFLGLTGTGHCIGMCGPLVVAIPGQTHRVSAHLLYHLGRTITYTAVGALMGSIGVGIAGLAAKSGADPLLLFAKIQVLFSVAAAGFLFWFGLSRLGFLQEPFWMYTASPDKIPGYQKALNLAFVQKRASGMFLIGLVMGLLPCGLSFAAFARALSAQGPFQGGVLLLSFALGTWPGLLLIGTGASSLFRKYRKHSEILSGILMIGMGYSLAADAVFALFG